MRLRFEFHRVGIAEIGMAALAVVEHFDVVDHIGFDLRAGDVEAQVGAFAFQTSEEAFDRSIVPAVALAT